MSIPSYIPVKDKLVNLFQIPWRVTYLYNSIYATIRLSYLRFGSNVKAPITIHQLTASLWPASRVRIVLGRPGNFASVFYIYVQR